MRDPWDYVDPLIDTAKPRIRWVFTTFAARPFGMVRPGPNTDPVGTWNAGYRYNSKKICCFSHLHAWQIAGVPIMPISGPLRGPGGYHEYASNFSHESESAGPGYYAVDLDDYQIRAELTATDRVGFHRYTFPENRQRHVIFDLGAPLGPVEMSDTFACWVSPTELEGFVENDTTGRRAKRCRVFFAIDFSQPVTGRGAWQSRDLYPGNEAVDSISGSECGVYATFADTGPCELLVKVGISFVSVANARANVEHELPHWNFEKVRRGARATWNQWLGAITVKGGTKKNRVKFYTDLWRCLVAGQTMSDIDGSVSFLGEEGPIIGKTNRPHICIQDGLWNSQWSLNLLYSLAFPETMSHICSSLVDMYRHCGLVPRGPTGGSYSFVMISAPSTPFLVSAYMKGIRDFDIDAAYEGMRKNAFPGGLMSKAGYEFYTCTGGGIEFYIERGYIPDGREVPGTIHVDGAAQTLEYAYQDWCLAQIAACLGKDDDYRIFSERSQNYRNLFDSESGFIRPRNVDGSWLTPFDPLALTGWCEANAWQYTWHVPHDIGGLIDLMGGNEIFIQKLNDGFEQGAKTDFYAPKPMLQRDKAYINYGNEPGRYVAHLFTHAGAPWLTQKWARAVQEQTFASTEPLGFREDDDNGKAAATSLLLAIGLFDLKGGADRRPGYEITAPVFEEVSIRLDSRYFRGESFTIRATANSAGNVYIQKGMLNDRFLPVPWVGHDVVTGGGRLDLVLGSKPNREWGVEK